MDSTINELASEIKSYIETNKDTIKTDFIYLYTFTYYLYLHRYIINTEYNEMFMDYIIQLKFILENQNDDDMDDVASVDDDMDDVASNASADVNNYIEDILTNYKKYINDDEIDGNYPLIKTNKMVQLSTLFIKYMFNEINNLNILFKQYIMGHTSAIDQLDTSNINNINTIITYIDTLYKELDNCLDKFVLKQYSDNEPLEIYKDIYIHFINNYPKNIDSEPCVLTDNDCKKYESSIYHRIVDTYSTIQNDILLNKKYNDNYIINSISYYKINDDYNNKQQNIFTKINELLNSTLDTVFVSKEFTVIDTTVPSSSIIINIINSTFIKKLLQYYQDIKNKNNLIKNLSIEMINTRININTLRNKDKPPYEIIKISGYNHICVFVINHTNKIIEIMDASFTKGAIDNYYNVLLIMHPHIYDYTVIIVLNEHKQSEETTYIDIYCKSWISFYLHWKFINEKSNEDFYLLLFYSRKVYGDNQIYLLKKHIINSIPNEKLLAFIDSSKAPKVKNNLIGFVGELNLYKLSDLFFESLNKNKYIINTALLLNNKIKMSNLTRMILFNDPRISKIIKYKRRIRF